MTVLNSALKFLQSMNKKPSKTVVGCFGREDGVERQ